MKIERLSQDKIRIFLTFDDLLERGIQKEDMWREIPKVNELFSEMMDQAHSELGFEASGPLAVEVFALPAQGMVVIVTRGKLSVHADDSVHEDDESDDDVYEMEVTLEQSDMVMYAFRDFEDVIAVARQLSQSELTDDGRLFSYNGKYIMAIDPSSIDPSRHNALIALLAEFGEATSVTEAVLEEYGKIIMDEGAVRQLCQYFSY